MLLEDSPCSMEDIAQKPSFRPMEDTSRNPSTERPPLVVDTLMKTDTHFGVKDSQAGNDVISLSTRTSVGRLDTETAITSRTPELENVDLEERDELETVPDASWLDLEPQSALKDNVSDELEPLLKRLTEADQSAHQFPQFIVQRTARQLIRDPKFFTTILSALAEPARAENEKNKPIVMSVSICCSECVDLINAEFQKMRGIKTVECDIIRQKVTVTGTATQADVLSAARRYFKNAEFWDGGSDHPSLHAGRSGAGAEQERRRGGTEREGEGRAREV